MLLSHQKQPPISKYFSSTAFASGLSPTGFPVAAPDFVAATDLPPASFA
jgi:hypothetical protein